MTAEHVTLVVQVNGEERSRIEVPADISDARARDLALASAHVDNQQVRRIVYVPGHLVNIVLK